MISEEELRDAYIDDLLCPGTGYGQWCYLKGKAEAEQFAWTKVCYHVITDEEREKEDYSPDWVYHLDCLMPDDNEEILVAVKHKNGIYVEKDICLVDRGYYLDSGYDWVDDIVAWRSMPAYEELNE